MSVLAHEHDEELPAWSLPAAARRVDPAPVRVAGARRRANGPGAARPGRACASASSTAASSSTIRSSATVQRSVAVTKHGRRDHDRRRRRGRPLRPRHRVRRDHPLARARVRADERPRARRGLHRQREGAARRARVGDRAGLRHRQPEPLDDEEAVRRPAARARRRGVLQARDADRVGAQHARRELSVAVRERRLGREPRVARPLRRSTRTRTRRSSSSRAASTSRSPGSAARRSRRPGTASRRRMSPVSARSILGKHPRADAVPAEERAAPDRDERRRRSVSDLRAAVAAGVLGADDAFRALLQATVETARGIFHAKAASVLPARRGDRRARLRGRRRRRRRHAARPPLPVEHGRRRAGCS